MSEDKPTTTSEPYQMRGFGAFVFTILVLTACVDAVNWAADKIVH